MVQSLLTGAAGEVAGQTSGAIGDGFAVAALMGAVLAALGIGPIVGLRKALAQPRADRRAASE